jgi:hypothetical protein
MNHLFKWLVFGVLFALTPLLGDYFMHSVHPIQGMTLSWQGVLMKGELLLVCSAISGAGVGELIGSGREWLPFKIICGGGCIVILFIAVVLYSGIANDVRLGASYDKAMLVRNSIWIFIATFVSALGCIIAAED